MISLKTSPTAFRILLLQVDVLTVSNGMGTHLIIDAPVCYTGTSVVSPIHPSYPGVRGRTAVEVGLSSFCTFQLANLSGDSTRLLSNAPVQGTCIMLRKI